jgi:hypothetical protein
MALVDGAAITAATTTRSPAAFSRMDKFVGDAVRAARRKARELGEQRLRNGRRLLGRQR